MIPAIEVASPGAEALDTGMLVVVVPAALAARQAPWFADLDRRLDGLLGAASRELAEAGPVAVLPADGRIAARRLAMVAFDASDGGPGEALRRAAGLAMREAGRRGVVDLAILLIPAPSGDGLVAATQALVEGALSAAYRFDGYKATPAPAGPATLTLLASAGDPPLVAEGARRGAAFGAAVALARDLSFAPPNNMGPAEVAEAARALALADDRFTVEVAEGPALDALGMGALRAVGQGSHRPPLFIVVRYTPRGASSGERPVVLIGKTVTFDAGGLSLKPALDMDRQKADLGGGAAVLGALKAAAALDLPLDIVALLPTVENMPGGGALRPGDVVRTLAGLTVEVLNTDAEGRLILADALGYARRLDPRLVIDVATLTGASAIVFGPVGIGFFSNDEDLAATLLAADGTAGERLWRLPLWPEHRALLRSEVADLANIASTLQQGSMMTAAQFLATFAGPWPWAHLDIYNTAWNSDAHHPTLPRGPTGSGARTLVHFLLALAGPSAPP